MFLLCKCKSSRSCVSLFIVNAYLQSIFLSTLTSIYIKAVIKAIKYCVTLPYKSRFRRKSRKYTVQEIIINRFIEKLLFPNVNLVLFLCCVYLCWATVCRVCKKKRKEMRNYFILSFPLQILLSFALFPPDFYVLFCYNKQFIVWFTI